MRLWELYCDGDVFESLKMQFPASCETENEILKEACRQAFRDKMISELQYRELIASSKAGGAS